MGLFDFACALGEIGIKTAFNIGLGLVKTAGDTIDVVKHVSNGEIDKACSVVAKRVGNTVKAGVNSVCVAGKVIDHGFECLGNDKKTFFDRKTIDHLSSITTTVVVADMATDLVFGEDDSTSSCVSYVEDNSGLIPSDASNIQDFSDNGMFDGNSSDLNELIHMGEIEGTDHIVADDEHRSMTARSDFLASHGYSSVPDGYEVHHIIPLCEGGSDTPENMILVSESEHDEITAAHAKFYGWRNS